MNIIYLWNGIRDQLPFSRLVKNTFKGHILGLFHKRSHYRKSGNEKVGYNTKKSAMNTKEIMDKRYNTHHSIYRCIYCGKYHLGKNRGNK